MHRTYAAGGCTGTPVTKTYIRSGLCLEQNLTVSCSGNIFVNTTHWKKICYPLKYYWYYVSYTHKKNLTYKSGSNFKVTTRLSGNPTTTTCIKEGDARSVTLAKTVGTCVMDPDYFLIITPGDSPSGRFTSVTCQAKSGSNSKGKDIGIDISDDYDGYLIDFKSW